MDRRHFLHTLALTAASAELLSERLLASDSWREGGLDSPTPEQPRQAATEDYSAIVEFEEGGTKWRVREDLRQRDGSLLLISSTGARRLLSKSAEATAPDAGIPPYLGLSLENIGMASTDLLAERLLKNGDPDPEQVKAAAPPLFSVTEGWPRWTTFVGTKEAYDVAPIYPQGQTRTYHPVQFAPELEKALAGGKLYDGLLGGWMPAVRKVVPLTDDSYWELIVFGDVQAHDKYIVQTWHRTALIQDGKMVKVFYGHTYPPYPPARQNPAPEEFYRALLLFAEYWDRQLQDVAPATLPEKSWVDMSRYAFVKELMTRPGGVYPKYGAVDRDYAGSEYDGFQDVFTSAIYTNMEWGRLETTRLFIDTYFSDFVDARGMVNMRGPETAQFGMTLSLLARYFAYSGDAQLLLKHRQKIEATAALLATLHDESLRLPREDPGYGLIHGWSESDSCLGPTPSLYWKPYYANSAFAARGFNDIARAWEELGRAQRVPEMEKAAQQWRQRSQVLRSRTIESLQANLQKDKTPPYIGIFPGARLEFRQSLAQEHPSPQQWAHRPYAELLQADVLPPDLASSVTNCMRAYGGTTLGIVANIARPTPKGRWILGFISYGYAQMLLRLDRIEEFLLFLYAHRYHAHTRGSWTAAEVAGITGHSALFCMPAQQTIPLLVRWMLLLDDSDADRVYLAKGIPRRWLASGQTIGLEHAPTRWGRISFSLRAEPARKTVLGQVRLERAGSPREVQLKFRLPAAMSLRSVSVNGQPAELGGPHRQSVIIQTGKEKDFELVGQLL